jgi:hypothetical protein
MAGALPYQGTGQDLCVTLGSSGRMSYDVLSDRFGRNQLRKIPSTDENMKSPLGP